MWNQLSSGDPIAWTILCVTLYVLFWVAFIAGTIAWVRMIHRMDAEQAAQDYTTTVATARVPERVA